MLKKGEEVMYIQQQSQQKKKRRVILIIVILLLCSGTFVQYVTSGKEKIFTFKPIIPSLTKASDMSNVKLPVPLENNIPEACQGANFQWM